MADSTVPRADADLVLDVVTELAHVLVGWSYEGTRDVERRVRQVAEATVTGSRSRCCPSRP
jgi:hypothetical protein